MHSGKLLNGTGILLALILFFSVNLITHQTFRASRFDLTQGKLYTLSPGSEHILSSMTEPVTLKLYFSKKLAVGSPNIQTYATRVTEMLEEYVRASHGLITLEQIDPEPFSESEDQALSYGLSGLPVDAGGASFYFGLVGAGSTDQESSIPFFQTERESFLEYDLTKLIHQLSTVKKPVMGLLSAVPFGHAFSQGNQQDASSASNLYESLESLFEIRPIDPQDPKVPTDVSVLLAIRPEKFTPSALFSLDQYVLNGGHAIVLTDPQAEEDQSTAPNSADFKFLDALYASWGVRVPRDQVVADLPVAKKVWFTPHGHPEVVDYPLWLELNENYLDQSDVVTSKLSPIVLSTPGYIDRIQTPDSKKTTIPQYSWTPLIQTDDQAMLVPTAQLMSYNLDPYRLLNNYKPSGKRFVLAARISGLFKTAFPEGGPSESAKKEHPSPLKTAAKKGQIILIADSDFIKDKFWLQTQSFLGQVFATPTAANGNLIVNAVDNLGGNEDLIAIRAQNQFTRPFTLIKALQQKAQLAFRNKEKELQHQLQQTEEKLKSLEDKKKEGNLMVLDADQRAEIERFRHQKIEIRSKLRSIQHELQQDISALENKLRLFNVYLFPTLIGIAGTLYLWFRRKQLVRQAIKISKRIAMTHSHVR